MVVPPYTPQREYCEPLHRNKSALYVLMCNDLQNTLSASEGNATFYVKNEKICKLLNIQSPDRHVDTDNSGCLSGWELGVGVRCILNLY